MAVRLFQTRYMCVLDALTDIQGSRDRTAAAELQRVSRLPERLRDVNLLSSTGSCSSVNDESPEIVFVYRRVYYEVVDRILSELSKRFDHSGTVLKAIAACSPKSSHFFDTEEVKPFAVQYGIDVDLLLPQLAVAKNLLRSKEVCNTEQALDFYGRCFPACCQTFIVGTDFPSYKCNRRGHFQH